MATQSISTAVSLSLTQRMTLAAASLLLGVFLVYGAGLANSATLHDTAHDSRHAYGFPCH